jgi:hypothetical protein
MAVCSPIRTADACQSSLICSGTLDADPQLADGLTLGDGAASADGAALVDAAPIDCAPSAVALPDTYAAAGAGSSDAWTTSTPSATVNRVRRVERDGAVPSACGCGLTGLIGRRGDARMR